MTVGGWGVAGGCDECYWFPNGLYSALIAMPGRKWLHRRPSLWADEYCLSNMADSGRKDDRQPSWLAGWLAPAEQWEAFSCIQMSQTAEHCLSCHCLYGDITPTEDCCQRLCSGTSELNTDPEGSFKLVLKVSGLCSETTKAWQCSFGTAEKWSLFWDGLNSEPWSEEIAKGWLHCIFGSRFQYCRSGRPIVLPRGWVFYVLTIMPFYVTRNPSLLSTNWHPCYRQ